MKNLFNCKFKKIGNPGPLTPDYDGTDSPNMQRRLNRHTRKDPRLANQKTKRELSLREFLHIKLPRKEVPDDLMKNVRSIIHSKNKL